jgi:uncharacterized membrane protein (TIGR02234 family)
MAGRRAYAVALVTGLAGALAVTVAMTRPWIRAVADVPGLPRIEVEVSGAGVAPLAGALGLVLLASFGAVVATRGWVRRVLGGVVVVAAIVVLVAATATPDSASAVEDELSAKGWAGGAYTTQVVAWRWLALAGALCCLVAGVAIAARGHRWPVMGSRYDAPPAAARPPIEASSTPARASTEAPSTTTRATTEDPAAPSELDEADLWRSLDRGHDPTREA